MRGTKPIWLSVFWVVFLSAYTLSAQYSFHSVFQSGATAPTFVHVNSWEELESKVQDLRSEGLEIDDLEVTGKTRQKAYWATFKKSSLTKVVRRTTDWQSLLDEQKSRKEGGWTLTDLEGSPVSDVATEYTAVWEKVKEGDHPVTQQIWKLGSLRSAILLSKNLDAKRFYLQDLECVVNKNGKVEYLLLFQQGFIDQRTHLAIQVNPSSFLKDRLERYKSGYRLLDMEAFQAEGRDFIVGIFKKGTQIFLKCLGFA